MTLGDDGPELQHKKSCIRSTNVDHVINKNVMVEYGAHCTCLASVAENRTVCCPHGWNQWLGAENRAHFASHIFHPVAWCKKRSTLHHTQLASVAGWGGTGHTSPHTSDSQSHGEENGVHHTIHK